MRDYALDGLVRDGEIKNYLYENVDKGGSRNGPDSSYGERLTIIFKSGKRLVIDAFCPDANEDTKLMFEVE